MSLFLQASNQSSNIFFICGMLYIRKATNPTYPNPWMKQIILIETQLRKPILTTYQPVWLVLVSSSGRKTLKERSVRPNVWYPL